MQVDAKEIILLLAFLIDDPKWIKTPTLHDPIRSHTMNSLVKKGLINEHGNMTKKGYSVAYAKSKGMNFEKEATRRGPRCSMLMAIGGLKGLKSNLMKVRARDIPFLIKFKTNVDSLMLDIPVEELKTKFEDIKQTKVSY